MTGSVTQITEGIKITVKTAYRPSYSEPLQNNYLFSYRIRIENNSDQMVKLLSRQWFIFDSSGEYRKIAGEGVVGLQPVLRPGDIHEYESACNLTTEMGKMEGNYLMERQSDGTTFHVTIPAFEMFAPYRLS